MARLDGQVALVTGGGSGIGRATCRRMAAEGARVAVVDLDGDAADQVAAEVGGRGYAVDVTDFATFEAAVADANSTLGPVSILFNNAGMSSIAKLHEWTLDDWNRVVGVNLTGVFHGFKAVVPTMLEHGDGRIVSTSSISGTRPAAGESPYSASKAAVAAITACAALEYAPTIRVNAVAPGMIRTGLTTQLLDNFPAMVERYERDTPAGRIGTPDDIADVVTFLCSDDARFITGQNLVVDGGMTLHGSGVDGLYDHVQAVMRGERAP